MSQPYDWVTPVNRKKALIFLIMASFLWSIGGLFIKLIIWHPMAIAGMRSALAALTIYIIAGRRVRFNWSPVQVGGAFAYAGTVTFFVVATKLTTAANAVLLQYTAPVYIAIFGYRFIRERTARVDWLVVAVTLCGMVLFFFDDLTAGSFWGNGSGVLSGFSFGLLILCMRKQKDGSPVATVLLGNVITALAGLPFMFGSPLPDWAGWGALAVLGIFQLGISYIIYSIALKTVTALEAVLIPVIEPLFNPLWVLLFLGEIPGPRSIIGALLILGSITFYSLLKTIQSPRDIPDRV
ncbi:MAG: DMT family transporter [Bacillota bacterium]